MKFTVKNDVLLKAVNAVKGTFGNKSFPALNNILFDVDANGLVTVKGSNGHETTTTTFQTSVSSVGTVLIDGFTMTRIVGTFADGDITIEKQANGFGADVTHPTGELEIAGVDPIDFVNPVAIIEKSSFIIPSKDFKAALESVAFARATGHANAKLNGVAIIVDNGRTSLFACDTTRVAKYVFDTPGATDINIVVGTEVFKGLSAVSGNTAIRLSDNGILFETNDTTYQGPVMTTGYPVQVNGYFAFPSHAESLISKEALRDVLERVTILSKAGKDDPHAEFIFKASGELEIQFKGTRGRIKSEKISIQHTGPDVTLKFTVDKILEAMGKMDKDNLEFVFPQGKNGVQSVNIFPEGTRDFGVFNMAVKA